MSACCIYHKLFRHSPDYPSKTYDYCTPISQPNVSLPQGGPLSKCNNNLGQIKLLHGFARSNFWVNRKLIKLGGAYVQ